MNDIFRSEILADRSLKLSKVLVSDEGVYFCRAENSVGFIEAPARLTVHCKCAIGLAIDNDDDYDALTVTLHNAFNYQPLKPLYQAC